jgi:hypothetical protein
MGRGYVKLHREAIDHEVFQDEWLWKLFCWCVLKANFKADNFKGEFVPRGSFVTGRMRAAEELGAAPSRVYRGLRRLEELGCITTKANSNWTTVTVCNYNTYQIQEDDNRTASERRNGQQTNTIEETNNPRNQPTNPPSPPSVHADPPGPADVPEGAGGLAGGIRDFGWGAVSDRLVELGASRWREAISEAKQCGCTWQIGLQIIEYGKTHGFQVGAMICRLAKAHPGLPIDSGWPPMVTPEAAAKRKAETMAERRRRESDEADATHIIKTGRRAQKSDEAIRVELAAAGLEWPK